MKKLNYCFVAVLLLTLESCGEKKRTLAGFDNFVYRGQDVCYEVPIDTRDFYFNPILSGTYSQASICRKNDTYYLTTSSFDYFPGLPVFQSNDLINWEQIGHGIDRISQMDMDSVTYKNGIVSPFITYNEEEQCFYMLAQCTGSIGNFMLKSNDPLTGWSDPVKIEGIEGRDISVVFDDDNSYILYCVDTKNENGLIAKETIMLAEYDLLTNKVGAKYEIFSKEDNTSFSQLYISSPRVYSEKSKHYLIASFGRNGDNVENIAMMANNIKGPYDYNKSGVVLSQKELSSQRQFKVIEASNTQLIKNNDNEWFAIFLGARPYRSDFFNTGKETFMLPVIWNEDYPQILAKDESVPVIKKYESCNLQSNFNSGNFVWEDNFNEYILDSKWVMIRTPKKSWYTLDEGKLCITPQSNSIYDINNPAFLGRRQQHTNFEAEVDLDFQPAYDNDFAGMVCYQNNNACYMFGKTMISGNEMVIFKGPQDYSRVTYAPLPKDKKNQSLKLKISSDEGKYMFMYSLDNGKLWREFYQADASKISSAKTESESGVLIGLYAYSPK